MYILLSLRLLSIRLSLILYSPRARALYLSVLINIISKQVIIIVIYNDDDGYSLAALNIKDL